MHGNVRSINPANLKSPLTRYSHCCVRKWSDIAVIVAVDVVGVVDYAIVDVGCCCYCCVIVDVAVFDVVLMFLVFLLMAFLGPLS